MQILPIVFQCIEHMGISMKVKETAYLRDTKMHKNVKHTCNEHTSHTGKNQETFWGKFCILRKKMGIFGKNTIFS